MIETGAPRSALYQIFKFNIIPRLNYSAFFDQHNEEAKQNYLKVDQVIILMFIAITRPKKYENGLEPEDYTELSEFLSGDPAYGGLNILMPGVFFNWFIPRAAELDKSGDAGRAKELWYKDKRLAKSRIRPIHENFANLVLNGDSSLNDIEFFHIIELLFESPKDEH